MMARIDLIDDSVRHHIGVQRLAAGAAKTTAPIFNVLQQRLAMIMRVNSQTLKFPTKPRLKGLLESVRNAIHEAYVELEALVFKNLNEFVQYEVDFQQRKFKKRLGVEIPALDATRVKAIAERGRVGKRKAIGKLPAFDGATVRQTLRAQELRAYRTVKKRIMLEVTTNRLKATE